MDTTTPMEPIKVSVLHQPDPGPLRPGLLRLVDREGPHPGVNAGGRRFMQFDLSQLPQALGFDTDEILDAGILDFEQLPGGVGAVDSVLITGRPVLFMGEGALAHIPAGAIVLLPAPDHPEVD